MNGVDRIIEDIRSEAEQAAAEARKAAEDKSAAVLEAAKQKAEEEASRIREAGSRKAADIGARSASTAALRRRQRILTCKQELIEETLDHVLEAVRELPDGEYFDALVRMAAGNAHPGEEGSIAFGARDLGRLPSDFIGKLSAALPAGAKLSLAAEPVDIADGFVLLYGGIEENCSFRAVLNARKEEMQDKVCGILFAE